MRRTIALLSVVLGLACAGDSVTDPAVESFRAFFGLTVAPKGVSIAVGGTQQLTVIPRDSLGQPLEGLPAPVFVSADTTKVAVSTSGLARGIAVGSSSVIARVQSDNLTYADTLTVTVTSTAKVLTTFTVSPRSATVAAGSGQTLTFIATDPAGARILGLGAPFYTSLDPTRATVRASRVTAVSPGETRIAATITVNGVTKVDTVGITVTNPLTATVFMFSNQAGPVFSPPIVSIAPGGRVTWSNNSGITHDATFASAKPLEGDVPAMISFSAGVTRTFPASGTYVYICSIHGSSETGKVIVQ